MTFSHLGLVLEVPYRTSADAALSWLLLDRFVTDRAAGTVNGTAAEPGPGVRGVTTANGATVEIAGSQLKIVGSGSNFADVVAGYDVSGIDVTRAVGKAALLNVETKGATTLVVSPQSAITSTTRGYFRFGNLEYYDGSSSGVRCYTGVATDTVYGMVFINRATGNFFLVDGQLLFVGRSDTNAFNFASIGTISNAAQQLLLDDVRLVQLTATDATLYPIPVLSDSFDRANGALGSTDGAGHLEGQTTPQGDGIAYSNAATWTISSNAATNTPSGAADYLCYAAGGDAEVYHSVKVTRTAGEAGIVLNAADTNNYLRVVHDGTNVITTEVVAGTPNVLSTVAKSYSAGARLEARRIANSVYVLYNGAFVAEVTPNAALQTNTAHGLYSDSSGNTFDNLETWPTTGYDYGRYA